MVNRKYQKGADAERAMVRKLKSLGYMAARSAGSHSPIDVWAIHHERRVIRLIQMKTGKSYSEKSKQKILEDLRKYQGGYIVKVEVL